jgi:hypothetical protein
MTSIRLDEQVDKLEAVLGLESGFFHALNSDDESDWSFVIKLHELTEAAVSYLLTTTLKETALADVFARLDMSNKATGKAAFVKALDLLNEAERRFVSSLSELRNSLVHDVRNVNFELDKHVNSLSPKDQDVFAKNFNLLSTDMNVAVKAILLQDPRQALWYSGMALLGVVYLKASGNIPRTAA